MSHEVVSRIARAIARWLVVIGVCFGAGAVWLAPLPASAHAIVSETSPRIDEVVETSPERVVMRFNEPVEVSFGGIRVFDTNARRVDQGETTHVPGRADEIEVSLEDGLADGTYTVAWHVVSADGHPISEAFVFHVGAPGTHPEGIASQVLNDNSNRTPGVLFGVVRWINFTALIAFGGALLFMSFVWLRAASQARPREVEERFAKRNAIIMTTAWITLAVATLLGFVLQGALAAEVSISQAATPDILSRVLKTRYGVVGLVKLGLLIVALVFWRLRLRPIAARRSLSASLGAAAVREPLSRSTSIAGLLLVMALVATPGLAGHAGSSDPVAVNVVADVLHVLAASAWIGGLFVLLVAAFHSVKQSPDDERLSVLAPTIGRFSDMATVALVVIVLTGIYRGWVEAPQLGTLTSTTYGWVLLSKVGVFLPVLALGAINNRWTKPRIVKAREGDDALGSLNRLKRMVTAEVALGLVILAITALLVNLPSARVEAGLSGPFITDVAVGDLDLNVLVDPNEVGENFVHLTATETNGSPARIKAMTVLFRMPSEDIGPIPVEGKRLATGHFVVQGTQLSVGGAWQLEIVVHITNFEEERKTVSVNVND